MANPDKLTLKGTIRDFKSHVTPTGELNPGGHIDFENVNTSEKGIVTEDLGSDKKPVYAGGNNTPDQKTTHGKDPFDQWYRDVAGVNQSIPYDITLNFDSTNRIYTFDSRDPAHGLNQDGLGGFFPIDNQGFGNEGRVHNYSFTYEIHTQFTFQGHESFTYTGDDDLWVFIDNKLVIDLGGVHKAQKATVDLKAKTVTYYKEDLVTVDQVLPLALNLTEQTKYDLDIFFAERHTRRSVFRIDTSLVLLPVPIATITASQPNADKVAQVAGEFTIALDLHPAEDITVLYDVTAASTAVAGQDYQALAGSITFSPADPLSKPIAVIPGATLNENANKTVVVALRSPASDANAAPAYKVADPAMAVVTIADHAAPIPDPIPDPTPDPTPEPIPVPVLTLFASKSTATKPARGQTATDLGEFTIQLTPAAPHDMVISFSIGGSAREGTDYQSMSRSVQFFKDQAIATMPVIPLANLGAPTSQVQCTLHGAEGCQLGDRISDVVTIKAPDPGNVHQPI